MPTFHDSYLLLDEIYAETKKYGRLIVPLNQKEGNTGNSECYEYVAAWAEPLILGNHPFGINSNNGPVFNPVKYSSKITKKHRDFNHPISTNSDYLHMVLRQDLEEDVAYDHCVFTPILQTTCLRSSSIFPRLIYSLNENPKNIFAMVMKKGDLENGHIVAARKNGKFYEFFDSASGWYQFDDEQNFHGWLKMYFTKIGYSKHYSFTLLAILPKPLDQAQKEKILASIGRFDKVSSYLLRPLLSSLGIYRDFLEISLTVLESPLNYLKSFIPEKYSPESFLAGKWSLESVEHFSIEQLNNVQKQLMPILEGFMAKKSTKFTNQQQIQLVDLLDALIERLDQLEKAQGHGFDEQALNTTLEKAVNSGLSYLDLPLENLKEVLAKEGNKDPLLGTPPGEFCVNALDLETLHLSHPYHSPGDEPTLSEMLQASY